MKKWIVITALLMLASVASAQLVCGYVMVCNNGSRNTPITGATVCLVLSNAPSNPAYRTTTDRNGHFVFQNVRAGTYAIMAQARGYVQVNRVTAVSPNTRPSPYTIYMRPLNPRITEQ